MPEKPSPHESEQFQQALELLTTENRHRWHDAVPIIRGMRLAGNDPLPGALRSEDDSVRGRAIRALELMATEADRDLLLSALDDPFYDVRVGAIYALQKLEARDTAEALIAMLDDPHPRPRAAAAWTLGWWAAPEAVEPLFDYAKRATGESRKPIRDALAGIVSADVDGIATGLRSRSVRVRRMAAEALAWAADGMITVCPSVEETLDVSEDEKGELARPAVPALIEALGDGDGEVRRFASEALAWLGDARAVDALLAHADDPDVAFRANVIRALASSGDPRAIERVLAACQDDAPEVRVAATDLTPEDTDDPRVLDALIDALDDEDADVRVDAVWGLHGNADPGVVEALKPALYDEDSGVASAAASALEEALGVDAAPLLIPLLTDRRQGVQQRAALALGRIGGDVVGPLTDALADATGAVREALLVALGQSRDPAAVPVLREAAAKADAEELQTVAVALACIDDPAGEEVLRATLRQGGAELREELARSMGRLQVASLWIPADPAQRLLHDNPEALKRLAAALAETMDEQELRGMVERLPEMGEFEWEVAAWILEEVVGERAVRILIEALRGEDIEVAEEAGRIVAAIGTPEAIDALREALSADDIKVRAAAASNLSWAGALNEWMPENELASEDPHTRAGGAILLAYAGHAEAIERLIGLLDDEHPGVRTYAAWGLGLVGADADDALEPLARQAESDPDPHARKQAAASIEAIEAELSNPRE